LIRCVELDIPATVGGRPNLPHSAEIDRPASVDLGEAEGLEGIDELTELANTGEASIETLRTVDGIGEKAAKGIH